jgi:hypothetical protein
MRYIFTAPDRQSSISLTVVGPIGQTIVIPQDQQWTYLTVEVSPDELPKFKEERKRCEYCGAPQ